MSNLLDDIVQVLTAEGITDKIYKDTMPESPAQVITFYEVQGGGVLKGGVGASRNIQVSVRTDRSQPVWAMEKAWAIFNVLAVPDKVMDAREEEYPETDFWGVITMKQTPFKIGVDSEGRIHYGFNMNVITKTDY